MAGNPEGDGWKPRRRRLETPKATAGNPEGDGWKPRRRRLRRRPRRQRGVCPPGSFPLRGKQHSDSARGFCRSERAPPLSRSPRREQDPRPGALSRLRGAHGEGGGLTPAAHPQPNPPLGTLDAPALPRLNWEHWCARGAKDAPPKPHFQRQESRRTRPPQSQTLTGAILLHFFMR